MISLSRSCHGWWKMNDNADDNIVIDSSIRENHATLYGWGPPDSHWDWTSHRHVNSSNPPYLNGALDMDSGHSNYIKTAGTLGNFGVLYLKRMTFIGWIDKWRNAGQPGVTLFGNTTPGLQLMRGYFNQDLEGNLAAGYFGAMLRDQDGSFLHFNTQAATEIMDGNPHLVVVIFKKSSGTGELWVDNVKKDITYGVGQEGTGTNFTNFITALGLGTWLSSNDAIAGKLDVMGLFNKVLSAEELAYLWNGRIGIEKLNESDISNCHCIYRGQDGNIDYDTIQAVMELGASQVIIPNQALPANTIWHYIRRQMSGCGLESDDSPACVVIIDADGEMIGSTPNPPQSLMIEGLSDGRLKLRWRYTPHSEEITPTGFKIYMDSGEGFDFGSPVATVSYGMGGFGEFAWTSDALIHSQQYRFCVRSYRTDAGESSNTNFVAAIADSEGPDAIVDLQASWKEI